MTAAAALPIPHHLYQIDHIFSHANNPVHALQAAHTGEHLGRAADLIGGVAAGIHVANRRSRQPQANKTEPTGDLGKAALSSPEARAKIKLVLHEHKEGKLRSYRGRNPRTGKPRKGPVVEKPQAGDRHRTHKR